MTSRLRHLVTQKLSFQRSFHPLQACQGCSQNCRIILRARESRSRDYYIMFIFRIIYFQLDSKTVVEFSPFPTKSYLLSFLSSFSSVSAVGRLPARSNPLRYTPHVPPISPLPLSQSRQDIRSLKGLLAYCFIPWSRLSGKSRHAPSNKLVASGSLLFWPYLIRRTLF